MNAWPDSSVGYESKLETEPSGHGFKSRSGQLSIATSNNQSYGSKHQTFIELLAKKLFNIIPQCAKITLTISFYSKCVYKKTQPVLKILII